jgi:hypothetical protein
MVETKTTIKGTLPRDFRLQVFYMDQFPPNTTRAPPISTTPAANFVTSSAGFVDFGGKFAAGVVNTGGKICR